LHLEFTKDGRNISLGCKISQDFQLQTDILYISAHFSAEKPSLKLEVSKQLISVATVKGKNSKSFISELLEIKFTD